MAKTKPASAKTKKAPRTYPRPPKARVVSGTREVVDSSEIFIDAFDWLGGEGVDKRSGAELRADSLLQNNRGLLGDLGIEAEVARRRGTPGLILRTSTRVGAVPLLSPVSGRPDFGIVVRPRFDWSSVGAMLAGTGFRVLPDLLPLPELPQSERRVPPWVLSSVILARLERLLDELGRRFIEARADLRAPRGRIDWATYARTRIPHARALDVPCIFPDLREDEELKSAIHHVVRRHRDLLLGHRSAGIAVYRLLELCGRLIARLAGSSPRAPSPTQRRVWHRRPVPARVFREGLSAIEWTLDERGLAGLSDLGGLSWRLDMAAFFEAWVEAIAAHVGQRLGASIRAGRRDETRVPLYWQPSTSGSQRSLIPDIVLHRGDTVIVFDAKYKRHAEDIERLGWDRASTGVREAHREDVLQALAYSTLFDVPRVVSCLVYPCAPERWSTLRERGRTLMRARARGGRRTVEIALAAVPLTGVVADPAPIFEELILRAI